MTGRKKIIVMFLIGSVVLIAGAYFYRKHKMKRKPSNFYSEKEFVEIPSSFDGELQKAYFHKSTQSGQPLLISLHTWGGTYTQADSLYKFAVSNNWNYIHPDYRGPHWLKNSCCFDASLSDLDDAIEYAIKESKADTSLLFLVGKSGGGSGVLAAFIKSKFRNLKCYAWSPITDYVQWHSEVLKIDSLRDKYLEKILEGTDSDGELNIEMAKLKSPQYYQVQSASNYSRSSLKIYSGIMDGIKGSTSIKQPMLFYNKILKAWNVADSNSYFDNKEILHLYDKRTALTDSIQYLGGRRIIHNESFNNIEMTFFDGEHEILNYYMVNELKQYVKDREHK